MKKCLYFAYGSNLDRKQMKLRCPNSEGISSAVLSNYKLVERTFADIEPCHGEYVHGALYRITEDDLHNLDEYEGYPECYDRREVMVTDSTGIFHKALVYVMTPEYTEYHKHGTYSEEYRNICSAGADAWGIPNGFVPQKEHTRCTLWDNGVPDIPAGLDQMFACLASNKPVPKAKRQWNGAHVVLLLKPQNIDGACGFYPAPDTVVTPHALELSWAFCDLRDLFKEKLNSMNKFYFFGTLAETASRAIENAPEISAAELCCKVIEKAGEIYRKSQSV